MKLFGLVMLTFQLCAQSDWTDLFNGKSLEGWVAPFDQSVGEGAWEVTQGSLHTRNAPRKADIWTVTKYRNFILDFEFRLAPGANGGIKYLVQRGTPLRLRGNRILPAEGTLEEPGDEYFEATTGLEFQIVDDAGEEAKDPKRRAGALYGLVAPHNPPPIGPDVSHKGRLVVQGEKIEHYLDGQLVVQVTLGSPEMEAAWDACQDKRIRSMRNLEKRQTPIALTHHFSSVWYRRIRIQRLP